MTVDKISSQTPKQNSGQASEDQEIKQLNFDDVVQAYERIKDKVVKTPLITNQFLNDFFKAEIYFKLEAFQKTGSFKIRGVLNAILSYQERHKKLPEKIVAVSTGNHAQAIACACSERGIKALIYMAQNTSSLKINAARAYGAEVIITKRRDEANRLAQEKIAEGYYYLHPSDHDDIILGQATTCLESLREAGEMDAIFAPCGGGGLVAGCLLAASGLSKNAKIFACEPLIGNDAAISVRTGKIFTFVDSPDTIADGARSLSVSERTFNYLNKIAAILEISEKEIIYFSQWLNNLLKISVEPTAALAFAGAVQYLKRHPNKTHSKILVILSGGNLSFETYQQIWQKNYLDEFKPSDISE
jgi:threonine dehydratase